MEELKIKFDFVVCRVVVSMDKFINWSFLLLKLEEYLYVLFNGLIILKGSNFWIELVFLEKENYIEEYFIFDFFEGEYYLEKLVIYV